jgi:single-stranded-DNA-specific exonuclease
MSDYTLVPVPPEADTLLSAYPPLVRRLLALRGIMTTEEAERFLHPDWERDTHDPFLMKDMDKAVTRVLLAMEHEERITIWSDYDMDGIPGAVVLYDFFREIGYPHVVHHTPHRNRDGFGLNKVGIAECAEDGTRLIITVDCGIGDVDLVAYANLLGMDVIVTDHHLPHETLPPAYAILNPKQPGCTYPERMLCGAGVAFKLAHALLLKLSSFETTPYNLPPTSWIKWLLDMAGMATIADMVPLVGENRALAHFGLVVLRKSRRAGLQALLKKARTDQRRLTEDDIGFTIAPRVNAASRMGHASTAFALLTEKDPVLAQARAEELDRINTERKTTVAVMKREIKRRLEKLGEPKAVIVLGNPEWKPSLLGLVAGGLAEEYGRPVFLWGKEDGVIIKGSCRSGDTTSVFAVMSEARHVFLEYGGHMHSGGFSVADEHIHVLEEALLEAHARVAGETSGPGAKHVDAELSLGDVTWDAYRAVAMLAPFGEGNPKPVFMFRNVLIEGVRTFGKGNEHLELVLTDEWGRRAKAIAFFTAPGTCTVPPTHGATCTVIAHLEANYFRSAGELRLRFLDVI